MPVNDEHFDEFDYDDDPNEGISIEEVMTKLQGGAAFGSLAEPSVREEGIGRNHVCPCGSGKRFKRCHGK